MHQVQMNYEVKIGQTNQFLYKPQSSRDTGETSNIYTTLTTPQDHSRSSESKGEAN
jgi:hypothetical protein